ncbi:hypothetical protein NQZ68_010480 [Dissostichus eleginoides]|nr:hypothetical protein NQZ68_010480 [Dissostichus eleginoides]
MWMCLFTFAEWSSIVCTLVTNGTVSAFTACQQHTVISHFHLHHPERKASLVLCVSQRQQTEMLTRQPTLNGPATKHNLQNQSVLQLKYVLNT